MPHTSAIPIGKLEDSVPHFLIQSRRFKFLTGNLQNAEWPLVAAVRVEYGPHDLFGPTDEMPRSVLVQHTSDGGCYWNANTGEYKFSSSSFLTTLNLDVCLIGTRTPIRITASGSTLNLSQEVESPEELYFLISFAEFYLPAAITLQTGVHVDVRQITGKAPSAEFRAELASVRLHAVISNSSDRDAKIGNAIASAGHQLVQSPRYFLALFYFLQAKRLNSEIECRRTHLNVAEISLNLAKCLEMLFGNRDAIRAGCLKLGLDSTQIESQIIPISVIRNELDIAHAAATELTHERREILREYVVKSLHNVRCLLLLAEKTLTSDSAVISPLPSSSSNDKDRLLTAIENYLNSPSLCIE